MPLWSETSPPVVTRHFLDAPFLTRLNEIRTMRLLSDVKTSHFHEQQRARLLGDILVSIDAITPIDTLSHAIQTRNAPAT